MTITTLKRFEGKRSSLGVSYAVPNGHNFKLMIMKSFEFWADYCSKCWCWWSSRTLSYVINLLSSGDIAKLSAKLLWSLMFQKYTVTAILPGQSIPCQHGQQSQQKNKSNGRNTCDVRKSPAADANKSNKVWESLHRWLFRRRKRTHITIVRKNTNRREVFSTFYEFSSGSRNQKWSLKMECYWRRQYWCKVWSGRILKWMIRCCMYHYP
jgi:hypothetical protein